MYRWYCSWQLALACGGAAEPEPTAAPAAAVPTDTPAPAAPTAPPTAVPTPTEAAMEEEGADGSAMMDDMDPALVAAAAEAGRQGRGRSTSET